MADEVKNLDVDRNAKILWILRGAYPRAKRRAQNDGLCATVRVEVRPLAAIRLATVPAFEEDDFGYEKHNVPAA